MQVARPFATAALFAGLAGLFGGHGDASAQQIYKIVGPDGRVTFSDKPPLEATGKGSASAAMPVSPGGANVGGLPYELRQVASRYPVTLYTAPSCNACDSGRAFLSSRGIPFAERTVTTAEDFDALKRLASTNSVPLLTIGAQQIKGYGETEWAQFLDAAGYPKSSQLPRGYSQSAPAPMVALEQARPARAEAAPVRAPVSPPPVQSTEADNPAGIRF